MVQFVKIGWEMTDLLEYHSMLEMTKYGRVVNKMVLLRTRSIFEIIWQTIPFFNSEFHQELISNEKTKQFSLWRGPIQEKPYLVTQKWLLLLNQAKGCVGVNSYLFPYHSHWYWELVEENSIMNKKVGKCILPQARCDIRRKFPQKKLAFFMPRKIAFCLIKKLASNKKARGCGNLPSFYSRKKASSFTEKASFYLTES